MLNTVVIRPQCKVPTAFRNPLVSPISTMRAGSNRNMNTGMKTMNMPYQPIATQ